MKAKLIYRNRKRMASGALVEEVIWKLPRPEADRPHGFKYRLAYVRKGVRIAGYDNERGKGDHRHCGGREGPYVFESVDRLIEDFRADVAREESACAS